MTMARWDPFGNMLAMRELFNRFFDETVLRPSEEWITVPAGPALNIYEIDDSIKIEVPLPGVKPDEVEVSIRGNTLTIKGEHNAKQEVKDEHYYRREVHYGAFTRSVTLPEVASTEQPEATFEGGVLTLAFKKVAPSQPKRIEITQPKELEVRQVG
jgi:HSP20 family protein